MTYQLKFSEQEIASARKRTQEDYGRAYAMYAAPPTEEEIKDALKMLRDAKVELAYAEFKQVANSGNQSRSCGCTGNKATTGYQMKSLSAGSHKRHYFSEAVQRRQDEAYEEFCSRFPNMCKG